MIPNPTKERINLQEQELTKVDFKKAKILSCFQILTPARVVWLERFAIRFGMSRGSLSMTENEQRAFGKDKE